MTFIGHDKMTLQLPNASSANDTLGAAQTAESLNHGTKFFSLLSIEMLIIGRRIRQKNFQHFLKLNINKLNQVQHGLLLIFRQSLTDIQQ